MRGQQLCRCGHTWEAHEHYRRENDCAQCSPGTCLRFRAPSRLLALLRRGLTGPGRLQMAAPSF